MSETSDHKLDEQENLQPLSHRRILSIMGMVVLAGTISSFWYVSLNFGFGFLLGGILSFVNYFWLKYSLKAVFDRVVTEENPKFSASRYFLRYFVLGLVLAAVFFTKIVSFTAVILGLLSFAFAILIEGLIRIFTAFFNKKEF